VARRAGVLELAVLGLLHESPLHGYELRKRLNVVLGSFRALSYGSLYPCLRTLQSQGSIKQELPVGGPVTRGRSKIVYTLTAEGKERFQTLLEQAGPSAWDDENFGVHFAFFAQTDAQVRLRILEGRRGRLEERRAHVRTSLARTRERFDSYTVELQRHGLESVEHEVRWLDELIVDERDRGARAALAAAAGTALPEQTGPATPVGPLPPETHQPGTRPEPPTGASTGLAGSTD
jgi:DNA-binding PadR family transcriptional regulator